MNPLTGVVNQLKERLFGEAEINIQQESEWLGRVFSLKSPINLYEAIGCLCKLSLEQQVRAQDFNNFLGVLEKLKKTCQTELASVEEFGARKLSINTLNERIVALFTESVARFVSIELVRVEEVLINALAYQEEELVESSLRCIYSLGEKCCQEILDEVSLQYPSVVERLLAIAEADRSDQGRKIEEMCRGHLCTLVFSSFEIQIPKVVLSQKSDYFKAAFSEEYSFKESKTEKIEFPQDISEVAVHAFYDYLEGQGLNVSDEDTLLELQNIAEYFQMEGLQGQVSIALSF